MLRKIASSDISKIYELGSNYDPKFKDKYDLSSYLTNDIYLMNVYEEDGLIKGFIIATNIDKYVEILLVYVDSNYRNHNIGGLLLDSIEEENNEILLEVSTENKIAMHLYEKKGYEVIAKREKYYNGVDALVMKKVLK